MCIAQIVYGASAVPLPDAHARAVGSIPGSGNAQSIRSGCDSASLVVVQLLGLVLFPTTGKRKGHLLILSRGTESFKIEGNLLDMKLHLTLPTNHSGQSRKV